MSLEDQQIHKIYDETASLIVDLSLRHQISHQEMHFLLNLLDQVVIKGTCADFLQNLKKWDPGKQDEETNEIIKATLLAMSFEDKQSVDSASGLIEDLVQT